MYDGYFSQISTSQVVLATLSAQLPSKEEFRQQIEDMIMSDVLSYSSTAVGIVAITFLLSKLGG